MINVFGKKIRLYGIIFVFLACFSLSGCGSSGDGSNDSSVSVYGFNLEYDGNIDIEKVAIKTDDLDEIIDLYQEVGDNSEYRDSLLIAEKFAQGLGANAFAQDNLDMLQEQGLTLSNIQKTQISLNRYGEKINAVLVEYTITEGLISDLPMLYVSQLFIPKDNDIILMSFITEEKSSHLSALDMFKNIK